jgi:drug/metabolite transporter (DMT)-like permease
MPASGEPSSAPSVPGAASSAAAGAASALESRGPWLAFLGCGLIWGSTFLVISIGNDTLPPIWAVAIRLTLAFVVLSLVMKLTGSSYPRGAAFRAAALYGICQFGLDLPLLYWGEKTVPSGLAAVLFATVPLSSAVIARLFRIEKLSALKIAGALVAIGGIALIGGADSARGGNVLGIAAILVAATVAGLGTTYLKLGPRQSPWGANAVGCLCGLPLCLLASAALHERWIVPPTSTSWFSILYLVLLGSCGAYALMAWLVHRWPVTRIAFIAVIVPIIALFLGAIVRHEPLTARSLAGAALVLVGLAFGMAADRGKAGAH